MAVASAEILFVADTAKFMKGVKRIQRATERGARKMARSAERIGRKWEQVGVRMTAAITLPLIGIGIAAGRASARFEDELQKINSLVGVSMEQINAWRGSLLSIGPAVGKGPEELAKALFFITSAGFRGSAALRTLIAVSKASAAGLGETEVVANGVTSAVNAYGEAILNADDATGIFIATVREGKFDPAEFATSIGRILPIASELEISFDQVGASIAALSRISGSATESVTAMQGILKVLLKPSEQATKEIGQLSKELGKMGTNKRGEKALKDAGLTIDDLRAQIKEKGLFEALVQLRKAFDDNGLSLGKLFRDVSGLNALLALTGTQATKNRAIFEGLSKAGVKELEDAFESASKTVGFKFRQAQAGANVALITLGDEILPKVVPLMERVVTRVVELARAFSSLSQKTKDTVLKWTALAAIAGPVILVTGIIIKSLGLILAAIVGFAGPAILIFRKVGMAFVTWVVAPIVGFAASAAVAVGAIPTAIALALAGTIAIFALFKDTILLAAAVFAEQLIVTVRRGFRDAFNEVTQNDFVKGRFIQLGLKVPVALEVDPELDAEEDAALQSKFDALGEKAAEELGSIGKGLKSIITGPIDAIKKLAPGGLIEMLLGDASGFDLNAQTLVELEERLKNIGKQFKDLATNASDAMSDAAAASAQAFQSLEDSLVATVRNGKFQFQSLVDTIINEFLRLRVIQPLLGALGLNPGSATGLFGGGGGGGIGGSGGGTVDPFDFAFPTFGDGGGFSGNTPIVVGDKGPEVLNPGGRSGSITPNSALGGTTNHFHFDVGLESVEDRIRTLAAPIAARQASGIIAGTMRPRHA